MVCAVYSSVLVTHKPVPGRCREHSVTQRPLCSIQCSSGSTVVAGMFTIQCCLSTFADC